MSFRFIPLETHSAAMNMALDEACMEAVRDGLVAPTLRIYRWNPSAITIGNFQCIADEVDSAAVSADGIAVVRRQTGGGAVFHDTEGEVTYSIIAPEQLFSKNIAESYREICACILRALAALGIAAEFRPINDLVVEGRKISGNAQTRRGGVLLQHGTILFTVDPAVMFRYLTPDKSKLADKPFIKSVQAAVTSVCEQREITREELEKALTNAFHSAFPGVQGHWTEAELMRAAALLRTKYASDAWNKMR